MSGFQRSNDLSSYTLLMTSPELVKAKESAPGGCGRGICMGICGMITESHDVALSSMSGLYMHTVRAKQVFETNRRRRWRCDGCMHHLRPRSGLLQWERNPPRPGSH